MNRKNDESLNRRLAALTSKKTEAPPPAAAKKSEKKARSAERKSTYRFGRIICDDNSVIACILKDLSATGARVMLEGEAALPPVVILKIDQTAESKNARVAWQHGREAGLDFD